jgi:hypothetical protein
MVMLSYDESGHLDFIEIGGETSVLHDGIQLAGRPLGAMIEELAQGGLQVEFDGDSSYAISAIGVELFTSSPGDMNEPAEGVSISPVGQG